MQGSRIAMISTLKSSYLIVYFFASYVRGLGWIYNTKLKRPTTDLFPSRGRD